MMYKLAVMGLGILEFDLYTDKVLIHRHYEKKTDRYKVEAGGNHFGGDELLARNFVRVMKGERSSSPLHEGISSATLCLVAKENAFEAEKHI